jgi:hypothetical protein
MNSLGKHSESDKKSFFPHASESYESLKTTVIKDITSGKSELANAVLREIHEFKSNGGIIDIDTSKFLSGYRERCQILQLLYSQQWKVEHMTVKSEIPDWQGIDIVHDQSLHWRITPKDSDK